MDPAVFQELSEVELLRYLTHLLRLNADCALQLLQGHVLRCDKELKRYRYNFLEVI
jgi:hypothetical protein